MLDQFILYSLGRSGRPISPWKLAAGNLPPPRNCTTQLFNVQHNTLLKHFSPYIRNPGFQTETLSSNGCCRCESIRSLLGLICSNPEEPRTFFVTQPGSNLANNILFDWSWLQWQCWLVPRNAKVLVAPPLSDTRASCVWPGKWAEMRSGWKASGLNYPCTPIKL